MYYVVKMSVGTIFFSIFKSFTCTSKLVTKDSNDVRWFCSEIHNDREIGLWVCCTRMQRGGRGGLVSLDYHIS